MKTSYKIGSIKYCQYKTNIDQNNQLYIYVNGNK